MNGRVHEPRLVAFPSAVAGETFELHSPTVGLWRAAPREGALIAPGGDLGEIEVLGVLHRLVVPDGARGMVVSTALGDLARVPVSYGQRLVVLDPNAGVDSVAGAIVKHAEAVISEGLMFRAPTGGRFYARPSPDKPPFVEVGDVIEAGRTVCLLEVMKTFNRVVYDAAGGLPERARVLEVVPPDESDLGSGDPILRLEPA